MSLLFAVHLGATFYMVGVIWLVQLVHYPMLALVRDAFADCQRFHLARMGAVVAPAMLLEAGTAVALVWLRPSAWLLASFVLLALIWVSTFAIQVPRHSRLAISFDARVHRELVQTNWFRTLAWTGRAICLLFLQVQGY